MSGDNMVQESVSQLKAKRHIHTCKRFIFCSGVKKDSPSSSWIVKKLNTTNIVVCGVESTLMVPILDVFATPHELLVPNKLSSS